MEDYYDDVEMPGSRLKIEFHGDRGTSEQILMIPFRDGDDVKYFVIKGICEGDRRVTRCDMVRVMDWDQLIEYLGDTSFPYFFSIETASSKALYPIMAHKPKDKGLALISWGGLRKNGR